MHNSKLEIIHTCVSVVERLSGSKHMTIWMMLNYCCKLQFKIFQALVIKLTINYITTRAYFEISQDVAILSMIAYLTN